MTWLQEFLSVGFRSLLIMALILEGAVLSAEAASPPKINPSKVTSTTDAKGKTIYCASIKGKKRYVIKKKKTYFPGQKAIDDLSAKISRGQGNKKKLQKQLKDLKAQTKLRNEACQSNPADGNSSLKKLSRAVTRTDVIQLLDKAGFGLGADEEALVALAQNQGIEALVDEFMRPKTEPAGLADRMNDELDNQIGVNTTQTASGQRRAIVDLWVHTNNPYAEKLAMFLLSVWTVSGEVIEDETFRNSFWDYYQRLRAATLGDTNVPELALAITRDPLMLIYLNNELNVKNAPNENYARELMELFTLGPSDLDGNANYTETTLDGKGDILTAARMLTGWTVKKDYTINKLIPEYKPARHEPGPHTMFPGKSYQFSGEDDEDLVQGIFTKHPGVKNYYAKELLKEYLTPHPPRALIEGLGQVIAKHGYKLRPAMRELLISEAFYDVAYRNTTPVHAYDFAARSARLLRLQNSINTGEVERQVSKIGMQPNLAPSVFWYPQDTWNSSSAILEKANLLASMYDDSNAHTAGGWSTSKVFPSGAISVDGLVEFVRSRLNLGELNVNQLAVLKDYLSRTRQYNGSYSNTTYDNTNSTHQLRKGLGLYYLLIMSTEFQLH